VDVKGKIIVVLINDPPVPDPQDPSKLDEKMFKGKAMTYYGRWTYKFEEAARQGALGAIIIHTTPTASYGWQVVRGQGRPMPQADPPPGTPALVLAGWITSQSGEKLLGSSGLTLAGALAAADQRGFHARPLSAKLRLKMDFHIAPLDTGNVIGMVPGSDPQLKNEAVIFTAHWDHLGIGPPVKGDAIYNGAVDNATGAAMLIEMARAWASLDPKPKRSAYFASVTAEESGLLGSRYLAQHPPVPAGRIAADLNFDSFSPLGRTRDAGFSGAERTSLWDLVQKTALEFGLTLKGDTHPEAGGYYRSDHFSFARAGVPAFSIGMGSEYPDLPAAYAAAKMKEFGARYHQPSDEYSTDWNFSGIEQFARLGFTLGLRIANLDHLPTWRAGDEFLPARQQAGVR
jgi:Zn-dependent M28 family amino/carboxypeptidase